MPGCGIRKSVTKQWVGKYANFLLTARDVGQGIDDGLNQLEDKLSRLHLRAWLALLVHHVQCARLQDVVRAAAFGDHGLRVVSRSTDVDEDVVEAVNDAVEEVVVHPAEAFEVLQRLALLLDGGADLLHLPPDVPHDRQEERLRESGQAFPVLGHAFDRLSQLPDGQRKHGS